MAVLGLDAEHRVRAAAFSFLSDSAERRGTPLVRQDDLSLFTFEGEPFRLMATQTGIWKPRQLNAALSFRTVHVPDPSQRPYDDEEGPDGFLRYKWRYRDPTDPANYSHSDNRAMRAAMEQTLPMIWFQGIGPGLYLPVYPVFLADEEPEAQQFVVALDNQSLQLRRDLRAPGPLLGSKLRRESGQGTAPPANVQGAGPARLPESLFNLSTAPHPVTGCGARAG